MTHVSWGRALIFERQAGVAPGATSDRLVVATDACVAGMPASLRQIGCGDRCLCGGYAGVARRCDRGGVLGHLRAKMGDRPDLSVDM